MLRATTAAPARIQSAVMSDGSIEPRNSSITTGDSNLCVRDTWTSARGELSQRQTTGQTADPSVGLSLSGRLILRQARMNGESKGSRRASVLQPSAADTTTGRWCAIGKGCVFVPL